jgi:hypothetical protein
MAGQYGGRLYLGAGKVEVVQERASCGVGLEQGGCVAEVKDVVEDQLDGQLVLRTGGGVRVA